MTDSQYIGLPAAEPPARPDPEAVLRPLLKQARIASDVRLRLSGVGNEPHAYAAGMEAGALEAALRAALQLLGVEW